VYTLHFIRRARDLGFAMEQIAAALWHGPVNGNVS
jgi:hypothetical protein